MEGIALPSESSHEVPEKFAAIVQEVSLRQKGDVRDRHRQMSRAARSALSAMSQERCVQQATQRTLLPSQQQLLPQATIALQPLLLVQVHHQAVVQPVP